MLRLPPALAWEAALPSREAGRNCQGWVEQLGFFDRMGMQRIVHDAGWRIRLTALIDAGAAG